MATLNPIPIPNPSEGIIRSAAIEDVISQQNSVQLGYNFNYDRMGASTVRPGVTQYISSSLANPIEWLGVWYGSGDIVYITTGSVTSGPFVVGLTLSDSTSGATGTIVGVDPGTETMTVIVTSGVFTAGDSIASLSTSATISTATFTAGGSQILAFSNLDIWAWDGTNWITKGVLAPSGPVRSANFINYLYIVDGSTGDPVQSYNGTTLGTNNTGAGSPGGALAAADFICAGLDSRLWVANALTNTLNYSDRIPIGQPLTTPANNFITYSPDGGQTITGLKLFQGSMLVFMQDSIYRVYNFSTYDVYPLFFVGTRSQESIVQGRDGLYFHHPSGFYRYSANQAPQEISRRIIDVINAIPQEQYSSIFGWFDDFDHLYWYCGAVVTSDRSFANLVCRYTITTQVWTLYDYFSDNTPGLSNTLTCATQYNDGESISILTGVTNFTQPTTTAIVAEIDSGTTDLGSPIFFEEISRWINLTQLQSRTQNLKSIMGMSLNAGGTVLDFQVDKDVIDKWIFIGTYDQTFVSYFQSIPPNKFTRFRFRKRGSSTGTAPVFGTVEITSWEDEGFYYQ